MKFKKFLMGLIVIISSLFITTVKADTAPNTFVINSADLHMLEGSQILGNGSTLRFTYKKTTTGKIVYCTDIHNGMTGTTETYTKSSELGAKYAYVLANGYPNKSLTGNNDKDYYITGLAIWYLISPTDTVFTYFNLSAGTYKGVSSQIVKEVAKLVNGAKNYSYANPTIKINNVTNNFTLSTDKKYFVSNLMSVTTTGGISTYNISLNNAPQGTIITDKNGNVKTSLNTNEGFYVKVPVSSVKNLTTSFSIAVSGTGYIYTAYKYNPTYNSHQGLMAGYSKPVNVNANANLKLEIKTSAEITKIDAATNKPLADATLVITGPNGYTKTIVSKNTAIVLEGLKFGKYTVTETKAPNGYKLSNEKKTFELTATNTSIKVVFENTKDGITVISKKDATTNEELPGATLKLTGPNNYEKTWTSKETPEPIKNLEPGKYTLTEEEAPVGYIKSNEKITFTVDKDSNVKEPVVMLNYRKGTVEISKQDATTGKELPGATLVLTGPNNYEKTWTSKETPEPIKNLEPGKYTLKETVAPNGYILSEEKVTFTINEKGEVDKKPVMKNYPQGTVEISKQDATTGKELPGATLVLTGPNNYEKTWTSKETPEPIKNLEPGKYTLKETIAPNGYILSEETITFTIDEKGRLVGDPVVMLNYPLGTILISKQDITSKEELYDAYLEVYKEDGTFVEGWTSGKEPHPIQLEPGKYYLVETQAPDGYILSEEKIEFEIDENGNLKDGEIVIMYNERIPDPDVPITSSFKSITTSIIGIITIVLGAIIITKNYKKNEEI